MWMLWLMENESDVSSKTLKKAVLTLTAVYQTSYSAISLALPVYLSRQLFLTIGGGVCTRF